VSSEVGEGRPPAPVDLTDRHTLHAVARRAGLVAKKRFGQNFLVDRGVLQFIVDSLGLTADDDVLEIGPGVGTLTGELATRARRVVAVDVDERCVAATRQTQLHHANVTVVHGDALHVDPAALGMGEGWLAAGNIPYSITTPLLTSLFEMGRPPRRGVFLVQREVAARLAASSGDWSLATVAVRSVADVERLLDVPPDSFDPPPAVHSSVVRLTAARGIEPAARQAVLDLARVAFQMRRKTLRHGITHAAGGDESAGLSWLAQAGIDAGRRPGTLSLDEWQRIAAAAATLPAQQ
jgi:16S rRNA (adenine1518-N6/adenine1519-N6)-dimethyltransferase